MIKSRMGAAERVLQTGNASRVLVRKFEGMMSLKKPIYRCENYNYFDI